MSTEQFRIPDASIRLDSMPTAGRDLVLSVGAADRLAIAEQLNITAVEKLEVKLHAVRFKGGIRVTGRLIATTVQPSVVSLEPVTQEIAMSVKDTTVDCSINGTVVASYPKAELVAAGKLKSTDGVYGIRFAHNTDAVVSALTMTKP